MSNWKWSKHRKKSLEKLLRSWLDLDNRIYFFLSSAMWSSFRCYFATSFFSLAALMLVRCCSNGSEKRQHSLIKTGILLFYNFVCSKINVMRISLCSMPLSVEKRIFAACTTEGVCVCEFCRMNNHKQFVIILKSFIQLDYNNTDIIKSYQMNIYVRLDTIFPMSTMDTPYEMRWRWCDRVKMGEREKQAFFLFKRKKTAHRR